MYKYMHGGNIYDEHGTVENIIDFSVNTNPFSTPEKAIIAAKQAIDSINIYPDSDCQRLRIALAEFEGVNKEHIFCTNGASDCLFRAVFAVKPKKVMVTAPSFTDYERAAKAIGAEIVHYKLKEENGFHITKDIVSFITKNVPDMIFICNPNNPTGCLVDLDMIGNIAKICLSMGTILIIDECFIDFVQDSRRHTAKRLMNKYKNLMIIKAFTKIFAMPGLRLGYVLCQDEKLLDRLRFCGADWPVTNVAQIAGLTALISGREFIEKTALYVRKEREYMTNELREIGLSVYESSANFIFFHCGWDANLRDVLKEKGYLIRDCSNFAGLEPESGVVKDMYNRLPVQSGYYRIAVSTEEKNKALIETMRGVKLFG